LQEHAWMRLAPGMVDLVSANAILGVVGAVINSRQRRAFLLESFAHPLRKLIVCLFVEIAAADTGLVGRDNDQPAHFPGDKASQLENDGKEFELVDPVNITMIDIDDAVPVDE